MNLVRTITQRKKKSQVEVLPKSAAAQAYIEKKTEKELQLLKQNAWNRHVLKSVVKELDETFRSRRRGSNLGIDMWLKSELENYLTRYQLAKQLNPKMYNKEYISAVLRGKDNANRMNSSQKTLVNKTRSSQRTLVNKTRSSQRTLVNKSGSRSGSKKRIAG